jgi:hypothetical protein
MAQRRFPTAALSALAFALCLTSPARPDDPLEEARRRREIAVQQIEADVRQAVREVNELARTNPAKAVTRLRQLIEMLDDDTALTPARRDSLKAMAKGRIRDLEADAARRGARAADDAERSAKTLQRRAADDRRADESARIARGLRDAESLRSAGRPGEANQVQSDLARRYPDSPAATAGRVIADRSAQVAGGRRVGADARNGFQGAMESVGRSAVAEAGDYNLPADWRERISRPTRTGGPKMTEQEKATLKALGTSIRAELTEKPLSAVIDYLQEATGVSIVADKKTLEAAGASYETPITTRLKQATLRTVLKKVLADVGLTYVIKDGVVQVVTPEEARSTMTVRTYYIGDLAGVADVRLGPLLGDLQARAAIAQIVDMIVTSIEPNSWESRGAQGGGTITFDPITMSLIVKQTAEVHFMLGGIGR